MKKPLAVVVSVIIAIALAGCPLPGSGARVSLRVGGITSGAIPGASGSTSSRITPFHGNTDPGEFDIWLFPTRRGNDSPIAQWNVYGIVEFPPDDNGEYVIPLSALPDSTFVLLAMDVSDEAAVPLGIIGLTIDADTHILEFPPADSFTGPIDFGNVVFHDSDIGISSLTAAQNEGAFSPEEFARLTELAEFSNTIRMVMNLVRNIDRDIPDQFYTEGISLGISLNALGESLSEYGTSADLPFTKIEMHIYSHDSDTKMQLFYPDGSVINDDWRYFNQGEQSAAKWFTVLSAEEFDTHAVPGALWPLKSEHGETLAEFDMSVAIVRDQLGTPMLPIPFLEYRYDGDSVESIGINWQYFAADGVTRQTIHDATLLERLIGRNTVHFQNNTTTYMFDRDSWDSSGGSLTGDLREAWIEGPDLSGSDLIGQIGFRFALYSVLIE